MDDLAAQNNSEIKSQTKANRGLAWLLALVVILLVAVGAYFILTPKETPLDKAMKMVKEVCGDRAATRRGGGARRGA